MREREREREREHASSDLFGVSHSCMFVLAAAPLRTYLCVLQGSGVAVHDNRVRMTRESRV